MTQNISIADRTKALAIRIVKACTFLDEKPGVCRTLSKQLLRSGTASQFATRNSQFAVKSARISSLYKFKDSKYLIELGFINQMNLKMLTTSVLYFTIANCELRTANCSEKLNLLNLIKTFLVN
nr:four helix bundle protein [Nostoc sp. FACHB-110]